MQPLVKKYSPRTAKDIINQDEAVKQLNGFIKNYSTQKKKCALLYGPAGTGKTSSAYALAKSHNLEIFELNASDFRNKEQIHQKLGSAMKQQSLFSKGKILLIDDVDGLSGTKDRGSLPEIIRLMQKSTFPVILTCHNPYHQKLSSVRSKSILVKYEPIPATDMTDFLKEIAKSENLKIPEDNLSYP